MNWNSRFLWDQTWTLSVVLFFGAFFLFLLIAYFIRHDSASSFDQMILSWFHSIHKPYLNHFFSSVTWLGSLWVLLPLYILLTITITPHILHFEKIVGITFWGSVITTYFLKYEFERKRPALFASIHELPIDPSFPSAHTAQITAFTLGLWLALHGTQFLHKEILAISFILVVLAVSASRIYLQVHFPTDVIAGMLIALMWGMIATWIIKSGVMG